MSEFVPKKSLLKNELQSMIEHLEAADSLGRTCNFKIGSAESEITEDVPLPWDRYYCNRAFPKRSLPTEKGCEPSPKKLKRIQQQQENHQQQLQPPPPPPPTTMATAPSQRIPDHKQESP